MYTARNLEDALSKPEETAELFLVGQGLTDFPIEIFDLPNLQVLDLSQNLLRELPANISNLNLLKYLKLRNNQLRNLPEALGEMPFLERIDLSQNQLSSLPESFLQSKLVEILLNENCFEEFPLAEFPPSLKTLVMANNALKALPDAIRHLFNLHFLDLRHNQIALLPTTLLLLTHLEHLQMSGNPIILGSEFVDPEVQLANFFRDFRRHTANLDEARAWLQFLQGEIEPLSQLKPEILLSALNCPIASIRECAREILPKLFENPFEAKKGAHFVIKGQLTLVRKSEALKALKEAGFLPAKDAKAAENLVILADRPEKWLQIALSNGNPIALEGHLATWLLKKQGKYLQAKAGADTMTENLRRLIQSYRKENIEMAMVMMAGAGVPKALLSDLLGIGLFHPDFETAQKGMEGFHKLASPYLREFVDRQIQINVDAVGNLQDTALIKALQRNADIEIEALVKAAMALKGQRKGLLLLLEEASRIPHYEMLVQNGALDLSSLELTSIPTGIETFKGLQFLKLSRNTLTQLPSNLDSFAPLIMLDLSSNQLTEIPDSIAALKQLKGFDLARNQLTNLPESIAELESLEAFRIDFNPIKSLPKQFAKLQKLELLGFYHCKFKEFPEEIWCLPNLKTLDIGECQFEALPSEMKGLQELESLVLRENPLKALPDWIGELPKLRFLDLSMLSIRQIPSTLTGNKKIERIYLIRDESMDWEQVLPILATMPALRFVYVRGRKIVRQMQLEIEAQLPKARIMWNS